MRAAVLHEALVDLVEGDVAYAELKAGATLRSVIMFG